MILTAGYDKLVYIWTVQSTESRYGQVLCVADSSVNHDLLFSVCTRCVVMKDTSTLCVLIVKVSECYLVVHHREGNIVQQIAKNLSKFVCSAKSSFKGMLSMYGTTLEYPCSSNKCITYHYIVPVVTFSV